MPLAIFALRQSAQPPRLEMPTPQRSDRFSLMQPEQSHPASSPMTSGQDKIAPPQLTTSRARNGRLRDSLIADLNSLQGRKKFPVRVRRELASKALVLCAFLLRLTHSRPRIDEIPCIFPASREFWPFQRRV